MTTRTPNFEAIEAAGLPGMGHHWCVWGKGQALKPDGKLNKTPCNARGVGLDSQKPETWMTYDEVKSAYLANPSSWWGVGYLPFSTDEIVGLDADGVLNDDGTVAETGAEIVAAMEAIGCYLEVSPSGRGLRGLCPGVKDADWLRKVTISGHSVEMYDGTKSAQYLTVTGEVWGNAKPLRHPVNDAHLWTALDKYAEWAGFIPDECTGVGCTEGVKVADLVGWKPRTDDEVIKLVLGSFNARGQMNKLWSGDGIGDYDGNSEARRALLMQLAYVTRDNEQIERIARRSKLDPARFNDKRNKHRNFLHYETLRALRDQKSNCDVDRAAKDATKTKSAERSAAITTKAKALDGGVDDLRDDKGKFRDDVHIVGELLIRDSRLAGVLWFDEFAGRIAKTVSFCKAFADSSAPKTTGSLEDDDLLAASAWLRREWGLSARSDTVGGAVRRWARATSVNPVADKLQKLAKGWDGVARLDTWLTDYCAADTQGPDGAYYLGEVGKRFLIGVVARMLMPGTKQDAMLVLEGGQGVGKSTAVRILAEAIDPSIYLEGFSLEAGVDCMLGLRGKGLGEWSELSGHDKREAEHIKQFLTKVSDSYRDPYGRLPKDWPRTISFVGTTNESAYLRDATGNRRYWPVKVGTVNLEALALVAPMLWAEAVLQYQAGARFWIDKNSPADARLRALCDREQRERLVTTAYDDIASDLADRLVYGSLLHPEYGDPADEGQLFKVASMHALIFGEGYKPTDKEWMGAAAALKRSGWLNDKGVNGSKRWRLLPDKAAELRQRHGLGPAPNPTGKSAMRKAAQATKAALTKAAATSATAIPD